MRYRAMVQQPLEWLSVPLEKAAANLLKFDNMTQKAKMLQSLAASRNG